MSGKLLKDIGLWAHRPDGSSACVMSTDGDTLSERCAAVMTVLAAQTNGPEEALMILVTLVELLKRECGVDRVDVEIVREGPLQ